MTTGARIIGLILACAVLPSLAWAQQAEPIVRTTIEPARIVVGQRVTLRIEVLAPNYMTAPAELPPLQIRNAVTRQLQSVNLSEPHGETTYAGVRFEFAVYPQEPGSYALDGQSITIHYAAEPPKSQTATLALPHIAFTSFNPDAAAQLDPFVSAEALSLDQQLTRSASDLKVGDSLTRAITIKAEGAPAMLLPPVAFAKVDGLALYAAQPSTQENVDRRTDRLTATRVDTATYMMEKAGSYRLPPVEVRWWNVRSGRVETARLDGAELQVAENPDAIRAPPAGAKRAADWRWLLDLVAEHWLAALACAAVLLSLLWAAPRALRRLSAWHRQRRVARLASEPHAFRRVLAAGCGRDPRRFYFALLAWAGRLEPAATVKSIRAASRSAAFDRHTAAIEASLFASSSGATKLRPVGLLTGLITARRHLRRQVGHCTRAHGLPSSLNPAASRGAGTIGRRY